MWPPTLTACECSEPGWCERHQCQKTAEWHFLCRQSAEEYARWEQGDGPCLNRLQTSPKATSLPACKHRGIEPVGEVECELCGQRSILVPVFACTKFGKCTERRFGNRSALARQTPACLTCPDYQPLAETPM